jgi:hypothetical protein
MNAIVIGTTRIIIDNQLTITNPKPKNDIIEPEYDG